MLPVMQADQFVALLAGALRLKLPRERPEIRQAVFRREFAARGTTLARDMAAQEGLADGTVKSRRQGSHQAATKPAVERSSIC